MILGAKSYREGKVFHFDDETLTFGEGNGDWAAQWEQRSAERGKPNHIAGWHAGDKGSVLEEPDYMKLAGPLEKWSGAGSPLVAADAGGRDR